MHSRLISRAQLTRQPHHKGLLKGISLSEYGLEGFQVRLRRLSEYGSVAYLVERPTRETQAEQYSDTVLSEDRPRLPTPPQNSAEHLGFCRRVLRNLLHSRKPAEHILQAGVDLVKNMGQGVSPGAIKDGDAFVGTVLHHLQFFCRWEGQDPATGAPTKLTGSEAARYMCAELLGKDNVELAAIEKMATFNWLLSAEDQKALRGLLERIVKKRLPGKSSGAKARKADAPGVEAASRMFG